MSSIWFLPAVCHPLSSSPSAWRCWVAGSSSRLMPSPRGWAAPLSSTPPSSSLTRTTWASLWLTGSSLCGTTPTLPCWSASEPLGAPSRIDGSWRGGGGCQTPPRVFGGPCWHSDNLFVSCFLFLFSPPSLSSYSLSLYPSVSQFIYPVFFFIFFFCSPAFASQTSALTSLWGLKSWVMSPSLLFDLVGVTVLLMFFRPQVAFCTCSRWHVWFILVFFHFTQGFCHKKIFPLHSDIPMSCYFCKFCLWCVK